MLKKEAYLNRINVAVFSQRWSVLHLLLQNMTPGCTAICKVIAHKRSTIKLIIVSLCFPHLDKRPGGLDGRVLMLVLVVPASITGNTERWLGMRKSWAENRGICRIDIRSQIPNGTLRSSQVGPFLFSFSFSPFFFYLILFIFPLPFPLPTLTPAFSGSSLTSFTSSVWPL